MTQLPPLDAGDFAEVFAAIHGHAPYAWQKRLFETIVAAGRWPQAIAAPTGAGKTAVLDIALFHLALEAEIRPRTAPMRIVLAVDRRIIADQAYERACRIRAVLEAAREGAPARMAARLSAFSGERPLHVAELRGGMPLERDWARRLDQPTILCTTVDQLGSRILFRGYGVSGSMAPVHAGLLGCDALLILDEAHLSRAFEETLAAIAARRQAEGALGLPWGFAALTATPRMTGADVFRLTGEERGEAPIRRRLKAQKEVDLRRDEAVDAEAFATATRDLRARLAERGKAAPVIAVVVNRVVLARQVFETLRQDPEAEAILLTGRVRPIERDQLIAQWRARLEGRATGERPLFVVATQCIEAGADFDFDAMTSQIAPLDALRQRFGRLARSGNRGGAPAPGIILAGKAETGAKAQDPIYGRAAAETWAWLERVSTMQGNIQTVDFGPDALDALIAGNPPGGACTTPAPEAPPLRAADLAALAMTAPRPFPDPDPAPFLHGAFRDEAEVSLVWRADLHALLDRFRAPETRDEARAGLAELLALLPPRPAEALRLPLWTARRWLMRAGAEDALADIPMGAGDENGEARQPSAEPVLRWQGREQLDLVSPTELQSGDVVILPAARGGCDAFGWAPGSEAPADDIAEDAAAPYAGQRAALRLHPAVWLEDAAPWRDIAERLEAGASAGEIARATGLADWAGASALTLAWPYGGDPALGAVLVASKGLSGRAATEAAIPSTEEDEGLVGPGPVLLADHARAVARLARAQAQTLGLDAALAETLDRAGLWHDDGKADPRFQLWLKSNDGLPEDGPPIAKTSARASPARQRTLRGAATLPERWRHEVASVRIAAARLAEEKAELDPDLLLWLIGTHHGHGRPFFAHDDDWDAYAMTLLDIALPPAPGPDKLDFDWQGRDWAGLMAVLQERYGPWGLAFLEACLRLADHRASAGEGA